MLAGYMFGNHGLHVINQAMDYSHDFEKTPVYPKGPEFHWSGMRAAGMANGVVDAGGMVMSYFAFKAHPTDENATNLLTRFEGTMLDGALQLAYQGGAVVSAFNRPLGTAIRKTAMVAAFFEPAVMQVAVPAICPQVLEYPANALINLNKNSGVSR